MLSPLHYLHHRPAARHGGLLKLPGKPSPLGQVCTLQAQVSQILCNKHLLCADTLASTLVAERTFSLFLQGQGTGVYQ